MDDTDQPVPLIARRTALRAVATVGAAGAIGLGLAACGSDPVATTTPPGGTTPTGAAPGAPSAQPTAASSGALVATADVPVGGAKVVMADGVGYVVAQPTAGTFVAHSAKCTHRGCTVGVGDALTLQCPCHGSRYDAATGQVERGPATRALAAVDVTVSDGAVRLA